MARQRKKIGAVGNYKKYTSWTEGDYISGKFISKGIDKTYGKPQFVIKLDDFQFADPTCTVSKKKEKEGMSGREIVRGMELTLNSAGGLDWRMDEVNVGDELEIVYKGTDELPDDHKFSGKDAHQFEVFALGDEDEDGEDGTDDL